MYNKEIKAKTEKKEFHFFRCAVPFVTLFFLVTAPLSAALSPLLTASVIESKAGQFTITLPKGFLEAEEEILPIHTEMGEIETVNYTSFSPTAAVMIGQSRYPDALQLFLRGKEKEVLEGAQEGALKNVSGTLLSEEELVWQTFPARSAEFTTNADEQPLFGRALFVLAGSRLFHLLFITNRVEELKQKETNDFFSSFVIKE